MSGQRWYCRGLQFLILGILLFPVAGVSADTLRLAANYWEPFTGENLAEKGFAAEIVTTALKRAGYDSDVKIMPWARVLDQVNNGEFDGIVAIWKTNDRSKTIVFSDEYYANKIVIIKRKDRNFKFTNLRDFTGLKIGVGRAYDYNEEFSGANYFIKDESVTSLQNLKKLITKRVDLYIDDELIAKFNFDKSDSVFNFKDDLEIVHPPIYSIPLYFGISKKYPGCQEAIGKFNRALAAIKADGTYADIAARHGVNEPGILRRR